MESKVRSADGTEIAYELTGRGPVLICVDGAMCDRADGPMRSLAPHLASALTVVLYDRRGRGASGDTLPFAREREVEDLAALIDAVGGEAALYGVSSGAFVALEAAAAGIGVTRLALFEPPLDGAGPDVDRDDALAPALRALIEAGDRAGAVEHFQASIGIPPQFRRSTPGLEHLAHTILYDLAFTGAASLDRIAEVEVPALVVASGESTGGLQSGSETIAEALPRGEHRRLPGDWHQVTPEVLAPVLLEHLAGTTAA